MYFLSKITEKAVAMQLTEHITENKVQVPIQYAYRPDNTTETALWKFPKNSLVSVDKGHGVTLILIDISSAFYTIDQNMLIDHLIEQIGVKALHWTSSSPTCPNIYKLSMSMVSPHLLPLSESTTKYHKVPQSSMLGPIKFSVYLQSPACF